jgi:methylated-DNA-[protein]-cysteine S-methyltransferase
VQSSEVHVDTPVGPLGLLASERGLRRILWPGEPGAGGDPVVLAAAVQQLTEYFAGARTTFALPLELEGTDFQRRAWLALAEIPYGETRSYGEQARRLGVPRAARAVGAANGANPLPIVLPCHRLVGADGSLTGFGGGLDVKRWLLEHESATTPRA